jgi:hypothetical protein
MADTDRPIPAEFSHWLWGRRYRVDAEGVTELDRYGNQHCFIPWRELERTGPTLAGRGGQVIAPRLGKKQAEKLLNTARSEWRARYPDAYRRDLERLWRGVRWAVFVVAPLPGVVLGAMVLAVLWWMRASGVPEEVRDRSLAKLVPPLVLASILVLVVWGYYFLRMRPEHERRMRDAGKTGGPQPGRERR